MTYLPQLHRSLVEAAARSERSPLNAASEEAPSGAPSASRIAAALRRLTRRRLFIFVTFGVLLAGSAAAAVGVLESQPSAPLSGSASKPAGSASPLAAARYSVSVTPNLNGGAASWCIAEQVKYPTRIPLGNASALRTLLVDTRTFIDRSIEQDVSAPAQRVGGVIRVLTPARARRAKQIIDAQVARLLSGLKLPARVRDAAAFQRPYVAFLDRYAVHGGSSGSSGCGNVATPGNPFVETSETSGGQVGAAVASAVYLTTPQVAFVRVSPTLTVRTRADRQLPDGFRIAVAVEQTQGGTGPPLVGLLEMFHR